MRVSFQIEGRPVAKSDEAHSTVFSVTPNYFHTMKIAVLQGRDFTLQDGAETNPVVIINESLARQFFPGKIRSGNISVPAYRWTRSPLAYVRS